MDAPAETHDISARDRRRQERRIWRTGLLISALIHLFVFVAWRDSTLPLSPFAAAGPRAGDNRAAKGSMQAVNLRAPPPRPIVPPPIPVPAEIPIEPMEFEEEPVELAQLVGELSGAEEGPGLEQGTGAGDGGNAEEGFFRLQPPTPRGVIFPPYERKLRGTELQVWVFVDERGRVVPDSTRLDPPTKDRDYNRRLIREAADWVFRPAVKEGKPVASWFPYRIRIGN